MTPVSDKAFAVMAVCPEAKKYYGITVDYLKKNQKDWLYFDVVMKSKVGKIMSKQQTIIEPKAGKRKYFVEQVYMAQEDFRRVYDIEEILIYWKED